MEVDWGYVHEGCRVRGQGRAIRQSNNGMKPQVAHRWQHDRFAGAQKVTWQHPRRNVGEDGSSSLDFMSDVAGCM